MSCRSARTGWLLAALVSATGILGCGRDRAEDQVAETVGLRVGDLVIFDGYVTAPVVEHMTMAYFTIENIGTEPDALVGASTDFADRVRLQSQVLDGPLGRRSAVERITIEPGRRVALEPGGFHLTLEDLRVSLAPGDSVTVRLRFERAGTASVSLPVLSHLELVHILSPLARDTAG
jgi:copper(I)-binding protein